MSILIGIAFGALVGALQNWLLFRKISGNRKEGQEPLAGIGGVFAFRYGLDVAALFGFGYLIRDTWAIISAAVSLTVAVKISLFWVYLRKGGRFD